MGSSTNTGSEKNRAHGRNHRRRPLYRLAATLGAATIFSTAAVTAMAASPASAVTPGTITTVAGGDAPGPVPATNVAVGGPSGVAVHGGKLYVTDDQFHVVRAVAANGGSETVVAGNGTQGSLGDGGLATEAEFSDPKGVAVDAAGNIVIADTGNNAVRIVLASTGITVSIGTGTAGYTGDGGPADTAELKGPFAVALDGAGNIVIADTFNNAIRVFANSTGTFYGVAMTIGDIYTVAGGNGGYSGDGGPATTAQLAAPEGIAVDGAGNLVIADTGNHAVRVLAATAGAFYGQAMSAGNIYTIAGGNGPGLSGDGGPASAAQFNLPQGVSISGTSDIIVSDTGNNAIRLVRNGNVFRLAGDGTEGFSGDGGTAGSAQLDNPAAATVDDAHNLVIADFLNSRVRVVAATTGVFYGVSMTAGNIYTVAGNGLPGRSGDGEAATQAEMRFPSSVVVDSFGDYVIAEPYDAAIRVVAHSTGTFYGVAMTAGDAYTIAGNDTEAYSGDGGPATAAAVNFPFGVGVDRSGNLIIADSENFRLRVIAKSTGTFYGQAMTGGDIYTIAGNGTSGYAGDGGPATSATLGGPFNVATDGSGNLLFSDLSGNNRVRVVAGATGTFYGQAMTAGSIYTIAGDGTAGSSGDTGPAASAELNTPIGVTVDHAGNAIISDAGNQRVRLVAGAAGTFFGQAMTAGNIYTIAGDGTVGNAGDGGPAAAAEMAGPTGVTVDAAGNLLFADAGNSHVRVVAASTGTFYGQAMTLGDIYTIAGSDPLGGYAGDGGPATSAILWDVFGVAVDHAGDVLIADFGNNRIRMVTGGPTVAPLAFGSLSATSWTVNQGGFSGTIAVSGGIAPYTLTGQSGLPTGLTATLSGSNISFTGSTTATGTFGSGSVTVKDATGATATTTFSVTINPPLSLGSLSTTSWTANQAGFSATIAVSGGTAPYTVSGQSGLPTGLTATLSGSTISFTGTPTSAGTFGSGSVTVKDATGATATATFSVTINPPLSFGSLSVTSWTVNQAGFSGTIAVSGGTSPYSLTGQGGLPAGLTASLSGSTISFTGTPTATGTFGSASVTIKDATGGTSTDSFSVTINNKATPTLVTKPAASSITLGQTAPTLTDTATVSGGRNPTGTVTFTLYYNGGASPVYTSQPVPLSNGSASASYALPGTSVQLAGMYQWDATYSGDANNNGVSDNDDPAELVTVTAPGEFAFGVGSYAPSVGVGSTSFGFVVTQGPKSTYSGLLNVVTPNRWWYQANVTSYGKTSKTQGQLAGTGTLYSWNATLNKGRGGWQFVASGVTYKATANAGTNGTASFGIIISSAANGLPNSTTPVRLTRGGISIM